MQPQRREVRVENDEYESEQQRLAKQNYKARGRLGKRPYPRAFCAVRNRAHIFETLST